MLMGPYCGMLLADLGAEVIKIEPPEGDISRSIGPHRIGCHNVYFASLNRNKKSVVIDLSCEQGQQALAHLAAGAHGLITNLRPAAIKKLRLTYDDLKQWNPRLVCVALTGYGLDSPWADRPAYDYVIQAATGIMSLTGDPAGPPTKAGYSIIDNSTAIMGALGLLARLVQGTGGQVDVAMYDTALSQLNYLAGAWLNAGEKPARLPNSAHPYIVPAQNFRTRDGWLTLFITHDDFWRRFCSEIQRPEWAADPTFATMAARSLNRDRLVQVIGEIFLTETTERWLQRLRPLGLVVERIESLESALDSETTRSRRMIVEISTEEGGIRAVGNPIKNTDTEEIYRPPPHLDEHDSVIGRSTKYNV